GGGERLERGGGGGGGEALFAEGGDSDDTARGRRALGEARQCRPHLAADPEQHDVARNRRKIALERGIGRRHEILERRHVGEALRQGAGTHAVTCSPAGRIADLGAAGIGRSAAKSVSPATAKPGQASEPRRSWPLSMRSRAGPFPLS